MNASLKLCISKIKRNKKQNLLIALVILLSTLLLSTALAVLNNTGNAYLEKHSELNGSHEILELAEGIYAPDKISEWWGAQSGVTASEMLRHRTMTAFTHKESNIEAYLYMTDAAPYSGKIDRLLFANGEEQETPNAGSIWIPTSLAYKNDIVLGDELTFKTDNGTFTLKVSGIVVDLPFCSPFSTNARIWMNGNDYGQYLAGLPEGDRFTMSLRFDDYSNSRNYWDAFEAYLGAPYLESVQNFEGLSSFYMITNQMIGFIMVFLAAVMLVIAVSSIGFTISDDILSSYKTIGIIKSMGMASASSIGVYVLQYAILAGFSVAVGIGISFPVSGMVIGSSLAYLKTDNAPVSLQFGIIALGVFAGLMLFIIACVAAFAYKTRRIQPVQAIRFGASEAQFKGHASGIKRVISFEHLPVTLVIGLREILRKLRSNLLIVIISALMTSVVVFGLIFINSFATIKDTISMWGYDSSDLTIRAESLSDTSYADFRESLMKDTRIKNYGLLGEINAVIPQDAEISADSMSVGLAVMDGHYDEAGFANIEGQSPKNGNEISLGVNLAKKYGVEVGDSFEVYIKGEKCSFVVTGIYQAIANMAYSGRVCIDAVQSVDPGYNIKDVIFVNLQEQATPAEFADEIRSRYGNTLSASTQEELIGEVFSAAVALLITPVGMISVIFVFIALVIIYCNCHISIKRDLNTYGIYKSVGMRSGNIQRSISSGILILEIIGAFLGLAIGIRLLPKLLNAVLANYGIVSMPLVVNYKGIILVSVAAVLIANTGAWFASKKIKKTSPRILTVE